MEKVVCSLSTSNSPAKNPVNSEDEPSTSHLDTPGNSPLSRGDSAVGEFLLNYNAELYNGKGTFSTKEDLLDCILLSKLLWNLLEEKRIDYNRGSLFSSCVTPNITKRKLTSFRDFTLFQLACLTNNLQLVQKYLDQGVDVNLAIGDGSSEYAGCSPLHLTLSYLKSSQHSNEKLSIVQLLLEHGAQINFKNSNGDTPLHVLLSDKCFDEKIFKLMLRTQIFYWRMWKLALNRSFIDENNQQITFKARKL